jgi:hypothetical protein
MKRSTFLLISAIIGFLFGSLMIFAPAKAAEGFGIVSTPEHLMFFRAMGEAIFAMSVLNYLVRNEGDSNALKAILIFNVLYHALGLTNDIYSVLQETITLIKVMPGIVTHLFIGLGSIFYLMRIKTTNK